MTQAETFYELKRMWEADTMFNSNMTQITSNRNYLDIIALGRPVLPILFKDMQSEPRWWFEALRQITGENPCPREHAGMLDMMTNDWLVWAREKGYIDNGD
jgi:hypothetical protein